jgi:hypothetical protein
MAVGTMSTPLYWSGTDGTVVTATTTGHYIVSGVGGGGYYGPRMAVMNEQMNRLNELNRQLAHQKRVEEKEQTSKKEKLKNLIAYYYQRN